MNVSEIRDLCLEAERLYDEGDVLAARAQAQAAVSAARTTSEPYHYALGLALTTAGLLAAADDDRLAAGPAFDEAVAIARACRDEDPEHAYAIFQHAAVFARECGEAAMGERLERDSLASLGESVGTEHLRYQQLKARLAKPQPYGGAKA